MANNHELLFSSPDPLGVSQKSVKISSSPLKRSSEKPIQSKALVETSNNVRLQESYLTAPPAPRSQSFSPVKVIAQNENPISPWRIRVTVEAEMDDPDQDHSTYHDNIHQRFGEKTTTTTVPLKDVDDPWLDSPRKARGRPRKSLDSSLKRAGTPKPKVAGRCKTVSPSPAKQADKTPLKKSRGRPRKSLENASEASTSQLKNLSSTIQGQATDDVIDTRAIEKSRPRSKGSSKALTPIKPVVGSDSGSLVAEGQIDSGSNERSKGKGFPKAKNLKRKQSSPDPNNIRIPRFKIACDDHIIERHRDGASIINNGRKRKDPVIKEMHDPTNEHQEYDSILESEGFSMVSLSSLPSAKLHSSCSVDQNHNHVDEPQSNRLKNGHTPLADSSSTSVPPSLKPAAVGNSPRAIDKVTTGTPKLVRVVRAGIALQGVLSPENASRKHYKKSKIDDPSTNSPKERLDNLFSGFGPGTRRELRAGLRLGEELARRQKDRSNQVSQIQQQDDVFMQEEVGAGRSRSLVTGENSEYSLTVPDSSQTDLYPSLRNYQLPSPDRSEKATSEDRNNWKADTLAHQETVAMYEADEQEEFEDADFADDTMMAREAEYQGERDAVIEQINAANTSQVIVIDSESDSEKDESGQEGCEYSDVWQEEARSSNMKVESPNKIDDIFQKPIGKPRRSQLPSPWRQESQLRSVSEASADESDHFWQPCRVAKESNQDEGHKRSLNDIRITSFASQADVQEASTCEYDEGDPQPESIIFSSPVNSSLYATEKITLSTKHERVLDIDLDKSGEDTWAPSNDESFDSEECRDGVFTEDTGGSQIPQSSPIAREIIGKASEATKKLPSTTQTPSSWVSYFTSFVPSFRKTSVLKPLPLLPNGKRHLPTTISEGPLNIYTPWTVAHFSALYIHYAAWKEGRATFRFNPRSPSTRYIDCIAQRDRWWRMVEPGDVAIADAFLEDLKRRGVRGRCGNGAVRIDTKFVLQMIFVLWVAGVMNGECEVGKGITGLTLDGEEMWRPELESWFKKTSPKH